jgi:hypothetical protein
MQKNYIKFEICGVFFRSPAKGVVMISMFNRKTVIRTISLGMSTVVLVGVGLLAGCTAITGSNTVEMGKPVDKNPTAVQENKQDKIMPEFMALVEGNTKPDAIIGFIGNYIASVSRDNAGIMLGELEKVQKNYLVKMEEKYYADTLQSSLNKVYKPGFDLNKIDEIQDAELKTLLIETRDMGYKVETSEGMYYPIMNYEYLKKYSLYATEDIMEYINIMAVETNKVPAKDAALIIGWDEVIERALAQESFIKKYGSSDKIESMKELQKRYLTFILYGLNNTPLFSYDTNTIEPEAKEVYQKAVKDNKDSELMQMLGKYMGVLEKSNYKLSDEVEKFRKDAVGSN